MYFLSILILDFFCLGGKGKNIFKRSYEDAGESNKENESDSETDINSEYETTQNLRNKLPKRVTERGKFSSYISH